MKKSKLTMLILLLLAVLYVLGFIIVRHINAWPYAKIYTTTCERGGYITGFDLEYSRPAALDISLKEISRASSDATTKITLELCSKKDVSFKLWLEPIQSIDVIIPCHCQEITLQATIPQTVTFETSNYWAFMLVYAEGFEPQTVIKIA